MTAKPLFPHDSEMALHPRSAKRKTALIALANHPAAA